MSRDGTGDRLDVERVTVLFCRHCEDSLMVVEELWIGSARWSETKGGGTISWRGLFWWPLPDAKLGTDVPEAIRGAYSEAATALAAGCLRAAAVMARRTLEAICADQGFAEKTLAASLTALAGSGKLVASMADWAKEVRLVGNKGAHFDPLDVVTTEDVRQLLSFLAELLKFTYELPAELKRRRGEVPYAVVGNHSNG